MAAVGAAIDTVDAISGFDEARRGNLGTRGVILGPVGAAGLAVLGVLVAREAGGRPSSDGGAGAS